MQKESTMNLIRAEKKNTGSGVLKYNKKKKMEGFDERSVSKSV